MRKPKYRPWPKRRGSHNSIVIDKDKVGELYFRSGKYNWTEFCELHGFTPAVEARRNFPVHAWQQEFTQRQIELQDEALRDEVLALRKKVVSKRIEYTEDWMNTAATLEALLNGVLRREATHLKNALDSGNMESFKLKPYELRGIAGAAKIIQDIKSASLLMPSVRHAGSVISLPAAAQDESSDAAEAERLQSWETEVMGTQGMDEGQIKDVLTKWFDHAQEAIEIATDAPGSTNDPEEGATDGSED